MTPVVDEQGHLVGSIRLKALQEYIDRDPQEAAA